MKISRMKKYCFLLLASLCMAACHKAPQGASISGHIEGMGTDTLYLYGADEGYDHIDTIYVENGTFSHALQVDTITSCYLLIDKRIEYPIFIDKNNQVTVKGDTAHLQALTVEGNIYNQEFSGFRKMLEENDSTDTVEGFEKRKAEEFIRQHNSSYVSLYLLDKYFVLDENPNYDKLKELTGLMSGVLRDKLYVGKINETVKEAEQTIVGRFPPYFSLPNAEGKKLSRTSQQFKEKSLLICFWASWADSLSNQRNNEELKEIYRTYKKNKYLAILGISFDMNRQVWLDAIDKDSLEWEQIYCSDGANSELIKQFNIQQLPYNMLLSQEGRIMGKDLHGEELKEKVKIAVEQAEKNAKKKK